MSLNNPEQQALRYNKDKTQLSFVLEAPNALKGTSDVLTFGAAKYARRDWKKGMPKEEVIDSLMRHLVKYMNGEFLDEESTLPHVSHILTNALFLAEFELRGDYNVR